MSNYSKIVIMSDCHRGQGDMSDNFADNEKLYFSAMRHYYDEGFTYIELGDGDELWKNRNFEDITEEHSHVFWMLRKFYAQNRLYMIYGNHDMVKKGQKWRQKHMSTYCDDRSNCCIPLFNDMDVYEGLELFHYETKQSLYCLHGHQADFFNDRLWRIGRFLVRYLWRPLELIGIKDPTSLSDNRKKKDRVERELINWTQRTGAPLIAGHTHRPVFPNTGEPLYFNDGSCVHPRCITALEIDNGAVSLVKWSVKTSRSGILFVGRSVLEEPLPLSELACYRASCRPSLSKI